MNTKRLIIFFFLSTFTILSAQEIIIQENNIGFCSVDGQIVTSSSTISGWTGDGYADVDLGIGKSISWQLSVVSAGGFALQWRYACRNDVKIQPHLGCLFLPCHYLYSLST